jgi:hypothetical protein
MEPGVKRDDLAYDAKIPVELINLAAQIGEPTRQYDSIRCVVGSEKPIDRGFDERGFCDFATLGGYRQPRGCSFGEIDADSGFHCGSSLKV